MMAKQSAINPKSVQKLKEKAILDSEKRIKLFEKITRKATKKAEKEEKQNERNRRKLLEPIQITNNRLQPVEYSTIKSGTLKWTTSNKNHLQKRSKDAPLKFSELVNNTNTIQRTNQFNSLLANVKGTLNGSTSSKLVRSLGAVSRKVQLKKQLTTTSPTDDQQFIGEKDENSKFLNQDQYLNGQLNVNLNNNLSAIKSTFNAPTVRSLTGFCRDADVLYVRKEPGYGLNKIVANSNLLYLNKLNDSTNKAATNSLNSLNSLRNIELNREEGDNSCRKESETKEEELKMQNKKEEEDKTLLPNNNKSSSIKSLDNNNNKRNLDQKEQKTDQKVDSLNKAKLKLKELFIRNDKGILKQNSINKMSSLLFKKKGFQQSSTTTGLTRATSEADLVFELNREESNEKESSLNDQLSKNNNLNRSQKMIQSTTKLNDCLNENNKSGSVNSCSKIWPGLGSMAFRHNLFSQVLQLSKQLNEDNYNGIDTFKRTFNHNLNNNLNNSNKLIVQKQLNEKVNHTNRLQLIQKMNKQLRNEQDNRENDSIGNSLSSRSTNSSTNSTLSSNLIETELTDELNMKLNEMKLSTQYKTRKSLKSIQTIQSGANQTEMNKELLNHHNVIDQKVDEQLDKKKFKNTEQSDEQLDGKMIKDLQFNEEEEANKKQFNQQFNQNEDKNDDENNEKLTEVKQLVNQLNCVQINLDQDDKLDKDECQRKQTASLTKKYVDTYERLNGQTLNRKETESKQIKTTDKLYEKKNEKLLKIRDKFLLNRMNARLDECDKKELNNDNNQLEEIKLKDELEDDKKIDSINNSLNDSSDNKQINQLDEESYQYAGTEEAIEKIPFIFTSLTHDSTHESNRIENQIKKFENKIELNKFRNETNKQEEDNDVKSNLQQNNLKDASLKDSHVFKVKLLVKNRQNDTQTKSQANSILTSKLLNHNLTTSNLARVKNNLQSTNSQLPKTLSTFKNTSLPIRSTASIDSSISTMCKNENKDNSGSCILNIDAFLVNNDLEQFKDLFKRERIDFKALMLLDEKSLNEFGIPIEESQKLINAILKLKSKRSIQDTCL